MADETPITGGGGPESQGVNFVLSVQDFGTEVLNKAEKAYQALMNTMRNVAQQSDKFVTNLIGKMTQASVIDKSNGGVAPIITPFTMTQKALDMMPKFAKASYEWLKNSASGMAQWAIQIGIAGSRTRDFRDALAQSEIEGKKFSDQFAGVGSLMGAVVGSAIGKTAGAAATALSGAVVTGTYMYSELYEKMHEVGMMQGWTTDQTIKATSRYIDLASSLDLNVRSMANIAHAMSEAHIPLTQANEDLLKFAAASVELSQIKPGGAVNDESVSAAIGNMIKIQKLNSQQVAAFLTETAQQVKTSSLTWVDALNLVGPAAQENFDQMFKGMSDVEKASKVSTLLPQIMAWGAAAKDANVPMEILQNVMRGLRTENTEEFQHLAALLGTTGHDLGAIQARLKGGDLTGGMNELGDAVRQFMNSTDSNATREFFKSFNSLFGEGAALRIANMAKASRGIDLTGKSMEDLGKINAANLKELHATPLQQLRLLKQNYENFWGAIGGVDNPRITAGLEFLNEKMKELFGYFSGHEGAATTVFYLGAISTGFLAVASAFKALQFLGITKVFTLMTEIINGAAISLKAYATGVEVAEAASIPFALTLAGIVATLTAGYELWKHKDFVESLGNKILNTSLMQKLPSVESLYGGDRHKTYGSNDIKLAKHLEELWGWGTNHTQHIKDSDYGVADRDADANAQKIIDLLRGIHQNTKDSADADNKPAPAKPSKITENLADWNDMMAPFLY